MTIVMDVVVVDGTTTGGSDGTQRGTTTGDGGDVGIWMCAWLLYRRRKRLVPLPVTDAAEEDKGAMQRNDDLHLRIEDSGAVRAKIANRSIVDVLMG